MSDTQPNDAEEDPSPAASRFPLPTESTPRGSRSFFSQGPTKPIMGNLTTFGSGSSAYTIPWTGGKPNNDWSSLEDSSATNNNPRRSRSDNPKSASSYESRQAGLYTEEAQKFKSNGDLDYFIKKLRTSFIDMGMDTIAYRRDPLDSTLMVDVLKHYPRLNQESMLAESKWCSARFDSYDKSNDLQAQKFLLASLCADLEKTIDQKSTSTDTFVDLLFILIEQVRPVTVDSSQALIERIKKMSPFDYPHQNVSTYVTAVTPLIDNLEIARLWDSMLNPTLCRTLCNVGGKDNGEYKTDLFQMLGKIQRECKLITHLTNQQKIDHMARQNLGWRDILRLAETLYKAQMVPTMIRWPPAMVPTDSKAAPGSFNLAQLPSSTSGNQGNGGGYGNRPNNRNRFQNRSNRNHGGPPISNPKRIPPDSNATPNYECNGFPIYQKEINGIQMEWCKFCNRYSSTHNSGTHTGNRNGNRNRNANGPRNGSRNGSRNGNGGNNGSRNGNGSNNGGNRSNNPSSHNAASASLGFGILPDPALWFAPHCIPIKDPPAVCTSPVLHDPATSANPTWQSVVTDVTSLLKPHAVCILLFGFLFNCIQHLDLILHAVQSISSVTLGEVFTCASIAAGPLLWFALMVMSLFGSSWLKSFAPGGNVSVSVPRNVRRSQLHHAKREHRRVFRHQRTAHRNYHQRQARSTARFLEDTACQVHYSHKHRHKFNPQEAPFGHTNYIRRSQEARKRASELRKSRRQRRNRRRYFRKQRFMHRRPHRLDLTDPIFRAGLGTALRQQVNSLPVRVCTSTPTAAPCSCPSTQAMTPDQSPNSPQAVYFGESIVLQHPRACSAAMNAQDTYTIVWDSGASFCVSFERRDFVGEIKKLPKGSCIQGISNNLRIEGIGEVIWSVLDTAGKLRDLRLPAYYIPKLKQRLLSTSVFSSTYPKNPITMNNGSWTIAANPDDPLESSLDIHINPNSNLPISTCFHHDSVRATASAYTSTVSAVHHANYNLSPAQKQLLKTHYLCGHVGFRTVQFLLRTGVLATSESVRKLHTAAARIPPQEFPKCAACLFGRQTNRAKPGRVSKIVKDRAGILSADQYLPGQRIHVDHFVCSTRGRKTSGYGIRDPTGKSPQHRNDADSYKGGCIFVDASTGFVHVELQSFLSASETVEAVRKFEAIAKDSGIIVSEYVTDNGSAFTSAAFQKHLFDQGQVSRFAGAGSHHQNGVAERCIRTIMAMARTMLLHMAISWNEMADPSLWSLAVKHAVWLYNHLPNVHSGLSPIDLWSKTRFPLRKLHDLHVFGSPVYVLNKRLSDGKTIGRWEARSQRYVHLGFSDKHATNVPLVLNPKTGAISAQWNVVFDDSFSTVTTAEHDLPNFNDSEWSELFGTTTAHFPLEHDVDDVAHLEEQSAPHPAPTPAMRRTEEHANTIPSLPLWPAPPLSGWPPLSSIADLSPLPPKSAPLPVPPVSSQPFQEESQGMNTKPEPSLVSAPAPSSPATPSPNPVAPPAQAPDSASTKSSRMNTELRRLGSYNTEGKQEATRRAKRERKPNKPLTYETLGGLAFDRNLTPHQFQLLYASLPAHHHQHIYAASKKKDPDTLSYDEAMADTENLDKWNEAASKEITQLEDKGCWEECLKSEATSPIIPCTWVFRVKRNPAGEIVKFKGRICLRGDLMDDDQESFAPVCQWSTVRYLLVVALIRNYVTVCIDWNNAFIQAVLATPIYMTVPRGFKSKYGSNGCLRLFKSLYGSKFAPRNWYQHLRKALLSLGFKESKIDPCLLYKPGLILCLYVDDGFVAATDRSVIDQFMQDLRNLKFDLDIESDFNAYLGIGIESLPDGSRHMTQSGLIKKILEASNMTNCNPNWTPCNQVALGSDPDGEPFDNSTFSYASIVGMLLYLSNNTRPDITFAVSQVARFTHAPKHSHAQAVKSIIRYLARTQDKGLIVKPDGTLNLNCWVDADFAGLHGREPESNPASAKSRYGYIVTFAGVPLVWKSQLISEICLSTLHAEYVGLSCAVRCLIPIRTLVVELLSFLQLPNASPVKVHCSVFEDNQSAYLLATNQRITSRTKYFNVKYHFFWSYVHHDDKNPGGWIVIYKCPTNLMNADYLTKGLVRTIFEPNRKRVQGW